MASPSVEELTLSLVREFLSRKGLKATLASMDQEIPRTEGSISNRGALAKAVGVEKLMKKNKEQVEPFRTILEVIVKWLLTKSTVPHDRPTSSHDQAPSHPKTHKDHPKLTTSSKPYTGTYAHVEHTPHTTGVTTTPTPHTSTGITTPQASGEPITYSSHTSTQSYSEPHKQHKSTSRDDPLSRKPEASSTASHNESPYRPLTTHTSSSQSNSLFGKHEASFLVADGMPSSQDSIVPQKQNPGRPNTRGHTVPSCLSPGGMQAGLKATTKKFKPRSFMDFQSEQVPPGNKSATTGSSSKSEPLSLTSGGRPSSSSRAYSKKGENVFGGLGDLDDEINPGSKVQSVEKSTTSVGVERSSAKSTPRSADVLMFEDLEDEQLDMGVEWSPAANQNPSFPQGRPITLETAKALRQLLFGTSKGPSFSPEWRRQNFVFSDVPGLQYGLVQHKGGPCGVLAAVQAYLLKHLIFTDPHKTLTGSPYPSPEERKEGLVAALGDILWKVGGGKKAVVALLSTMGTGLGKTTPTYQLDHITERMILHELTNKETVKCFIRAKLPQFEDESSSGCIQFLLSVLLTKGVNNIRSEMDDPNGRLIGAYGYCTQELVNLLLTGAAVSNVFNGDIELGGKDSDKLVLRGLRERSEIGLLSLFEHYQSCKVGSHYKDPVYPVWVVCSESHFSVIFSTQTLNKARQSVDLHYYDGLANQDAAIRLTIDIRTCGEALTSDDTLTPPLELCIRTRWPSAAVNWNGTEPIL